VHYYYNVAKGGVSSSEKVLLEYEQMDFQSMTIQELQRSAVVVDHQYFVEDHSKTCHEQYPEAKAKGQKMKMLEG
jgi:hypothetical protein